MAGWQRGVMAAMLGLAMTAPAFGDEGELDAGFASNGLRRVAFDRGGSEAGKADVLVDLLGLPDGRILLLGSTNDDIDYTLAGVARLLPSGNPDNTFGGDGRAEIGTVAEIAPRGFGVQPDGHVVIAAVLRDSPGAAVLLRLNDAGMPDGFPGSNFNALALQIPGGNVTDVAGLHMLPDGRFYVYGTSYTDGLPNRDFFIARLTANGVLDASFGVAAGYTRVDFDLDLDSVDVARAAVFGADGRIALIGEASSQDTEVAVAMLDDDGDLLAAFDDDGRAVVDFDVGLTSDDHGVSGCFRDDGRLIVAANVDFTAPQRAVGLAALTASGSLLNGFGVGGRARYAAFADTWAARIACTADGKFVMAGTLADPSVERGPTEVVAVRFGSTGSPDASFGESFGATGFGLNRPNGGREDNAVALVALPRGAWLVGFDAQYNGPDHDYGVARLQGTGLFADGFE